MKKILVLFLFTLLSASAVFSQGITFEHNATWAQIVAKAKKENKLIFLDAYTSWCGPCKLMQARVFPDETLGTFHNKNFVNAKIDMETGEGPNLASQFRVRGYPTLFYINPNTMEVVHSVLGYRDVNQLLSTGQTALQKKAI
jgi:thiol:disulfide interchange protein